MTTKPVKVRAVAAHGQMHGTMPTALRCECHPCSVALMGADLTLTRPCQSIAKAEHDALMAHRDRPLTQARLKRHHGSGNGHQLGELL